MLAEEEAKGRKLQDRLSIAEIDRTPSEQVRDIRAQLKSMKEKMDRLEREQMDVGKRPVTAMDQISQPILDGLKRKVDEDYQPALVANMKTKISNNQKIAAAHQQIFDCRLDQVNLRHQIYEQRNMLSDFSTEISNLLQRQNMVRDRKSVLQQKLVDATAAVVEETKSLKARLR